MSGLEFDKVQLAAVQSGLSGIRNGAVRAINAALNKTVGNAKTLAVAGVGARLNLTNKVIGGFMEVSKSNFNTLSAKLSVVGKPVPLINYGATAYLKGVSVKVRRDSAREKIAGAFIATMPNGHVGVFKRGIQHQYRTKAAPRRVAKQNVWGNSVLPIDELHGPHVSEVFRYEAEKATSETSAGLLAQNLDHEMNRVYTQYWR